MAIVRKRDKSGKFTKNEETTKKSTNKKEKVVKEKVVDPEVKVEKVEEVKEAPIVVNEPVKEIKKEKVQGLSDFLF